MSEFAEHQPTASESRFESNKTKYFSKLAVRTREAMALHQERGLWERQKGTREWGNVAEHSLVEAARAETVAEMMGLSEEMKNELIQAAALHDFYKKDEIEAYRRHGSSWEQLEAAERASEEIMAEHGWPPRTIRLAGSVGWHSLPETIEILKQPKHSAEDMAFLILHYVDDYTVNAEWTEPSTIDLSGKARNDLDRRIDKNEQNATYRPINEAGRQRFGGRTLAEVQREIGHAIEKILSEEIAKHSGQEVDPLSLPEVVDEKIKQRIAEIG